MPKNSDTHEILFTVYNRGIVCRTILCIAIVYFSYSTEPSEIIKNLEKKGLKNGHYSHLHKSHY